MAELSKFGKAIRATQSAARKPFNASVKSTDREGSEPVVIVNEALAAKFFPGEDPLGKMLQTFGDSRERIVGIVGDTAEANLTDAPVPARYMLFQQLPFLYNQVSFVLRTDSIEPASVLVDARSAISRESSQLAVQQTTTMKNIFDLALGPTGQVVTVKPQIIRAA